MVNLMVLMDNTAGTPGTTAEHGLSFLVERNGRHVIFDTGETGAFLDNARILNVDLAAAEGLVLSHGHYDHSGGVRTLCSSGKAPRTLWTGPSFFDRKYSVDAVKQHFIGVNFDTTYLRSTGIEHRVVQGSAESPRAEEILNGLFAINGFPQFHLEERQNPRFVVDRPGGREQDDFRDEICLAADIGDGLVVFLGCAHPGMMNMLDTAAAILGKPVRAVFGGSHLVEADGERLEATLRYLQSLEAASPGRGFVTGLGHCTGKQAAAYLHRRLESYVPLQTGMHMTL